MSVKTGEEILKTIPRIEYQDNGETIVDYEVLKIWLKDVFVVPEEEYVSLKHSKEGLERIKTLIENEPRFSDYIFGKDDYTPELEAKSDYILALHPWLRELRKELE